VVRPGEELIPEIDVFKEERQIAAKFRNQRFYNIEPSSVENIQTMFSFPKPSSVSAVTPGVGSINLEYFKTTLDFSDPSQISDTEDILQSDLISARK
jgi:hypothetical protein